MLMDTLTPIYFHSKLQKKVFTFFEAISVCHTVQVGGKYSEEEDQRESGVGWKEPSNSSIQTNFKVPEIVKQEFEKLTKSIEKRKSLLENLGLGQTHSIHRTSVDSLERNYMEHHRARNLCKTNDTKDSTKFNGFPL
jgi:hypothetical protein